ncbi:MAG TPA: methyl-accepting chemotaxis protein, partial [Geothrix sp.]|nr:methyl-accepting chemotaxis protein [Geothrix sp.]
MVEPVRLDDATREIVLRRIRGGIGMVWGVTSMSSLLLFLFSAPPEFRITAWGAFWALLFISAATGASLLHVRQLESAIRTRSLGPDLYRPLTRFPQASSLLFFYLGTCLSTCGYFWVKLRLGQSLWVSLATMGLFLVLAGLGSVCLYFLTKQKLIRVFRLLAAQPGFADSSSRFTTTLGAKFGFGILGITGGVLLVSILVSGLSLKSSIRTKVTAYARNELINLADSVSFVEEMNTSPEDLNAFLGTLKLGAGGGVSLRLTPARGGGILGSKIQPVGAGDILVVQPLPGGSELRAVIPEAEYADAIWKALWPQVPGLLLAAIFLTYFIRFILRDIQHPLLMLSRNTQQVGEGRIDRLEAVYSDDEVSALVNGFGQMVGSLRGMVVQIRSASRDLAKASAAIRESADGVRQSSQGQRQLIEDFHQEINELTDTSIGISASSMELSLASESTNATIVEMAASVQQINQSMDELLMVVEGITSAIRDFDMAIKNVGKNIDHLAGHAEHTKEFAENLEQSTSAIDDSVKIAQRYTKKVI